MTVRGPAVAGAFYPDSKKGVTDQLKELFSRWGIDMDGLGERERIDCAGVVVPHAGWPYSGYVAARTLADVPKKKTVVLMGPNHYGLGPDFSISGDDEWETPLGKVDVDTKLAEGVAAESAAELDELAHLREHSIEVQLPLLQTVLDDFRILPISIKHYAPDERFLGVCQELGSVLAEKAEGALFVASTDFTHYEPQEAAMRKDEAAMGRIEELDGAGLFREIRELGISMCGYAGVAAAMSAGRALGASKAERVAYMTSGDTTGDVSAVVGYGGLRIL